MIDVPAGNATYIKSGNTTGSSILYIRNGDNSTIFRVTGNGSNGPDDEATFYRSL